MELLLLETAGEVCGDYQEAILRNLDMSMRRFTRGGVHSGGRHRKLNHYPVTSIFEEVTFLSINSPKTIADRRFSCRFT